ncbi:MAG: hypothetical protein J3Q66DRAFT_405664 [Benniella sp.]|nr:MAG: hypothetical protein J3Q66DRAFT_405664 [Benniella sp.]
MKFTFVVLTISAVIAVEHVAAFPVLPNENAVPVMNIADPAIETLYDGIEGPVHGAGHVDKRVVKDAIDMKSMVFLAARDYNHQSRS